MELLRRAAVLAWLERIVGPLKMTRAVAVHAAAGMRTEAASVKAHAGAAGLTPSRLPSSARALPAFVCRTQRMAQETAAQHSALVTPSTAPNNTWCKHSAAQGKGAPSWWLGAHCVQPTPYAQGCISQHDQLPRPKAHMPATAQHRVARALPRTDVCRHTMAAVACRLQAVSASRMPCRWVGWRQARTAQGQRQQTAA